MAMFSSGYKLQDTSSEVELLWTEWWRTMSHHFFSPSPSLMCFCDTLPGATGHKERRYILKLTCLPDAQKPESRHRSIRMRAPATARWLRFTPNSPLGAPLWESRGPARKSLSSVQLRGFLLISACRKLVKNGDSPVPLRLTWWHHCGQDPWLHVTKHQENVDVQPAE